MQRLPVHLGEARLRQRRQVLAEAPASDASQRGARGQVAIRRFRRDAHLADAISPLHRQLPAVTPLVRLPVREGASFD